MIYGFDIYSFVDLCSDDSVTCAIYDMRADEEVFRGELSEAKYSDFGDCEICAIDLCPYDVRRDPNAPVIIFNIETDEEDEESEEEDE